MSQKRFVNHNYYTNLSITVTLDKKKKIQNLLFKYDKLITLLESENPAKKCFNINYI